MVVLTPALKNRGCTIQCEIKMRDSPSAYALQALSMQLMDCILPCHGTSPTHDGRALDCSEKNKKHVHHQNLSF